MRKAVQSRLPHLLHQMVARLQMGGGLEGRAPRGTTVHRRHQRGWRLRIHACHAPQQQLFQGEKPTGPHFIDQNA